MSYPKSLSKKSLDRLYADAGLTEKQIEFLHRFFLSCANLYGVIMAEDAWDVYRELSSKTETVFLHRKDMYAALGILRRESVPFYVFEANEVFSEEPQSERYRVIALRELVPSGYGKFTCLYQVMDTSAGKSFYVPKNLLEYADMPENKYESRLLEMLGRLKSTLSEYQDRFGRVHPCPYKGKYLRDFSYISDSQDYQLRCLRGEVDGHKGNAKKAAEYEVEIHRITAAQYLVNNLKWHNHIGAVSPTESLEFLLSDLNTMGVSLSDDQQLHELVRAVTNMSNNQNLWCNHGWTPRELSEQMRNLPVMCFGKGIQEAFANGTMDKEELVRMLNAMGIEVLA